MTRKSPDAFRTISEVAEWLDTPAHVLRFWESRFAQVKPVKRAGGRRYYRPNDMLLLGGIKKLLHEDGMTIRAVQKLLREKGVKHVAAFSAPLIETEDRDAGPPQDAIEHRAGEAPIHLDAQPEPVENVIEFQRPAAEPAPSPDVEPPQEIARADAGQDAGQTDAPPEEPTEAELAELRALDGAPEKVGGDDGETEPDTEDLFQASLEDAEPAEAAAETEPAPRRPLPVTVPEDPADDMPAGGGVPEITAVARSLRSAHDKLAGLRKPQPDIEGITDIYRRLTALRERMEKAE